MLDLGIVLTLASPYTVALIVPLVLWQIIKNEYRVYVTPYNMSLVGLFIWAGISGVMNRSWLSLFASAVLLVYLLINIYFQNHFDEVPKIEHFLRRLHKFSLIAAGFGIAFGARPTFQTKRPTAFMPPLAIPTWQVIGLLCWRW